MKRLLIIIDGMDDEPIPALDNRTPASYAHMPALGHMRAYGKSSSMQTVPDKMEAATDVAILTILGYRIDPDFSARSWLEALGAGIHVDDNDLCLRCNLITLKDGILISHNGMAVNECESKAIMERLGSFLDSDKLTFHYAGGFRNILIIHDCTATVKALPPHTLIGQPVSRLNITSDDTVLEKNLNKCISESRHILHGHTANGISLWAPGRPTSFHPSTKGTVVAGANVVKGIGHATGMSVTEVAGATADEHTNYTAKLQAALKALENDDFVLLHIEAPDEASHQHDWLKKIRILEDIDSYVLTPLLKYDGNLQITVQADHATSSLTGNHLSTPVNVITFSNFA